MDAIKLLDRYHSRLIALERRSPLTATAYEGELRRFIEWINQERLGVDTVDSAGISRYLDQRRYVDGIEARSVAKAISALRSFFRFAEDEGLRIDNPAAILEPPRRSLRLPQVLSRKAVERVLDAVAVDTPIGIRDRALFELIYSAGLRVSELVALDLTDLSFKENIARVTGKGNKQRLVPFGGEALHWLGRYLAESRPKLAGLRRSPALFISRSGKRLSRKGIWKNYAAVAALAGTGSKLHTLRHSYATELLAGGADLRSVQELMGHADLGTTQIYTHVDNAQLRENHRRYLPRLRGYTE